MGNNSCTLEDICEAGNDTSGSERRKSFAEKSLIKFTQKDLVKIKKYEISKDYMILTPAIGKGSFGSVYKIVNRLSGMVWVAKKIPLNPKMSKHLQQIYILKQLDHPNVIRIIDIYEEEKFIYVVMEYCAGGQLFERIIQRKNMTQEVAKNYMNQILSAVSYCHSNRIIHRDLKPENIMLVSPKEDTLKIIDFGAGTFSKQGEINTLKVGSVYYIAPEVIKKQYNEKCDIWSCGVILYMMLSGVAPFNAKNDKAIFQKILSGKFSFPEKKWKQISSEAKDLVTKMLEFDPEKRLSARQALSHPWFRTLRSETKNIFLENQISSIQNFCNMNKFKQCILVFVAHNLSAAESIQKLNKHFKSMDKNNDGRISWTQFQRSYHEYLSEVDQNRIRKLFKSLDKNQSGFIDYSEFVTYMLSTQLSENKDMISKAFDLIDSNQDNRLQKSELVEALGGINQELFEQIMNECDLNKDGYISRQQFINGIMSLTGSRAKKISGAKTRAETKEI